MAAGWQVLALFARAADMRCRGDVKTQANTCFNELLLPPYPSKDLLAARLMQSLFDGGDVFMLK